MAYTPTPPFDPQGWLGTRPEFQEDFGIFYDGNAIAPGEGPLDAALAGFCWKEPSRPTASSSAL